MRTPCLSLAASFALVGLFAGAEPSPAPAEKPAAAPVPAEKPAAAPAPAEKPADEAAIPDVIPDAPKGEALLKEDLGKLIEKLMAVQSLESFDAREELLEIGRPAVDALLLAAKDKRPEMRHLACDLLGEIRDPKAVPVLVEALGDKDEFGTSVASAAARALGRCGDRGPIPALVKALESPDRDLRYEAARALGILRADEAKAPLRKLLKDAAETSHHYLVRCAAAEALGRLRDRDALEDLGALLADDMQERRTERRVKLYAALALERLLGKGKGNLRGGDKEMDDALKAWAEWWKKRTAKPEEKKADEKPAGDAKPEEKK